MAEDSGERTEQATDKRMRDVRSKGQLAKSEDFTAWVGVGAAALMLPSLISRSSDAATEQLVRVADTIANPDPASALDALADGGASLGVILGPFLGVLLVAVLGTAALQGGIHVKKFSGKFEQFNVVNGLKRILGGQALWQGAKALLKTAVVGLVLVVVVQNLMPVLMAAGGLSVASLLNTAGDGTAALLRAAVVAGLALAAMDVLVVMRRNRKKTRMTKKEVKDENKNSDGDPLIKSQRRSRQLAMSRNRMIAAVGGADVVLVNPTHVAVALTYEPGRSAPRVVAKGSGVIAAKIREEAEKKQVPMVSDIPLARALHAACELGQEIPFENYDQVARILAFVMSLRTRGAARGLHTLPARPSAAGGF
ncbi:EscU/YscU/HrcU family type III secretion system export apparatus switch protein [Arthrobacter sp. TmT3-37]|jgi:flagellar biosynthetic protein FlhB|uniref:Type III secretion protein n=1 Tax=Arthrobacter agilis TaxID=37921 RepID=A0A2L0UF93_9MICC|nr:EscU/YscU/HrcU family type III secretion system export apparatus switch protein [Arthrobacter agilis]AUZ87925.1 type III secretion protein [Arthrobacter agilis]